MMFNGKHYNCPMEMTMDLIGGKWKVLILWHLSSGIMRFNEMKRLFPDMTQKMLTQQLRGLERDGIILRKAFAEVPPKVEYSLTEFGSSLVPLLQEMNRWGQRYLDDKNAEEAL